jgi:hypothetical protein
MNDEKKSPRKRIGNIALQDSFDRMMPLDEQREKLRDQLIMEFLQKRTKEVVEQRFEHINGSREIAEHVRFFFDENGNPPKHTTPEDIAAFRQRVEQEVSWLEALANELKRELRTLKQLEKSAHQINELGLPEAEDSPKDDKDEDEKDS